MLQVSQWLNDGMNVNTQVAGTKILTRLEQSIANPLYSPEKLAAKLKLYGFGDEQTAVFTEAYAKKDINIAKTYFNEKIAGKGVDEAIVRTNKEAAKREKALQKEKRGIYNVTFNDKKAAEIRMDDLESVIRYEKGSQSGGATHIVRKHLGDGKYGELTPDELLNMGEIIRNGDMPEDLVRVSGNGIKTYAYELSKDGVRYRVAILEDTDGKKIATMYSDKNVGGSSGRRDPVSQSPSMESIIPQKLNDVKTESKTPVRAEEGQFNDEANSRNYSQSSPEAPTVRFDNPNNAMPRIVEQEIDFNPHEFERGAQGTEDRISSQPQEIKQQHSSRRSERDEIGKDGAVQNQDKTDGNIKSNTPFRTLESETSSIKSILRSVGEKIRNAFAKARGNRGEKFKEALFDVDEQNARMIKEKLGIDIEGGRHVANSDDLLHIEKKHGKSSNDKNPITNEDMLKYGDIVYSPDKIAKTKTPQGFDAIIYEKKIGDTFYVV
ncbi:MAG: hypothetical protein LBJ88_00625 [Campylobacteraceae bacterium]|jgi:predicted GNAT family acetyltransferase|nr:hypothetical protein [Campylobacteraceae bacterium]